MPCCISQESYMLYLQSSIKFVNFGYLGNTYDLQWSTRKCRGWKALQKVQTCRLSLQKEGVNFSFSPLPYSPLFCLQLNVLQQKGELEMKAHLGRNHQGFSYPISSMCDPTSKPLSTLPRLFYANEAVYFQSPIKIKVRKFCNLR